MKLNIFDGGAALLRKDVADYLKVGDSYKLAGAGITKLDESPGAQSDSETYINEVTASSSITSYETSFAYTSRLIADNEVTMALWNTGRNHDTGAAAQFDFVRVDMFNPIGDPSEEKAEYKARRFRVTNVVSTLSGGGGEKIAVDGNLEAIGDPVQGKFDTVSMEFTEGTFEGKYDKSTGGDG